MVPIRIPRFNQRVWQRPAGKAILTNECRRWLETHVGYEQFRHPDSEEYDTPYPHWIQFDSWFPIQVRLETTGARLYFSDAKHAVLFKLTWL